VNVGKLYYPMKVTWGPHDTVVVCDQIFQPGLVWTKDGLYAGSFYDRRAEDGLPDDLYRSHSDDMQGVEVVRLDDGRVLWFNTVQGMNLIYEVTGWDHLRRDQGVVRRPRDARAAEAGGTGLRATYYTSATGDHVAFQAVEAPIYFDPYGSPPHPDLPEVPYRIVWEGDLEPPLTDDYVFEALKAADERIVVQLDGQVLMADDGGTRVRGYITLAAAERRRIRIDYVNREGRPELKFLWWAVNLDKARVPAELLYPAEETP
jgi:hypothetical protein